MVWASADETTTCPKGHMAPYESQPQADGLGSSQYGATRAATEENALICMPKDFGPRVCGAENCGRRTGKYKYETEDEHLYLDSKKPASAASNEIQLACLARQRCDESTDRNMQLRHQPMALVAGGICSEIRASQQVSGAVFKQPCCELAGTMAAVCDVQE